ncbi:MAG: methylated-DNA--[protein]-cysteine S-methyltransferase [Bacteroidetes bacterium]|nr:methylated-DNA--[protein]-cysteine S-methyltransferase [Bacteroidota bacterium]
MNKIYYSVYNYEVGNLKIFSTNKGICYLGLPNQKYELIIKWFKKYFNPFEIIKDDSKNKYIHKELKKYFENKLRRFNCNYDLRGTKFQRKIWVELLKIPFSQIISYKQLAEKINHKKSYRAVGNAIGKNPVAIIIPCHRVIATNGSLGGYSGGIRIKKLLLNLENEFSN